MKNFWSGLESNPIIEKIGMQRLIAILVLVFIFGFFSFQSPAFRTLSTFVTILDVSYFVGFLAIGVTFVIITGGIDLSVGTVMMCAAIVGGVLYNDYGWSITAAMFAILAVGVGFGLLNGVMVAYLRLPAFIATLGTMMISRGVGSIVSGVRSVSFPLRAHEDGWFRQIFRTDNNFPTGMLLLVGCGILAAIILNKTKLGRYIFSIGSNIEATRLSGVNVARYQTMAYCLSGLFAGVAAIAFAATYTTILPGSGGGVELEAIAAAVVGGVSLAGGVGSILGTFVGVYIMTVLRIGLPFIGLQPHYQVLATGVVVMLSVYADVYRSRKHK